jgi:hypothetical protein
LAVLASPHIRSAVEKPHQTARTDPIIENLRRVMWRARAVFDESYRSHPVSTCVRWVCASIDRVEIDAYGGTALFHVLTLLPRTLAAVR